MLLQLGDYSSPRRLDEMRLFVKHISVRAKHNMGQI